MTEKEKAAKGLIYNANNDPELQDEMLQTRCKLHQYNSLSPDKIDEREALIRTIVDIQEGGCIISPFYCDYGYNIHIGKGFFSNTNLVILDGAEVTIGNNVYIAPGVGIYTAGHPLDVKRRNAGLEYAYPIKIGNNVWIGAQCIILPGITIGDNAVIAAGTVVNRDVPNGMLVAGNPCRIIREINQKEEEDREDFRPRNNANQ